MREPSDFQIQRDERYKKTFQRDMRRQKARRLTQKVGASYERMFRYPQWRSIAKSEAGKRKLSTCIITMNSAHRIRPLLEYIRGFSDEIVVGVDSKTADNTFEACQGLADELFMIQNDSLTCNAGLEALVDHCHGDWILRLDDDEFPEPEFIRYKAGILATERYTHYKLPRLHLSYAQPETLALSWINDGYLYPDYQMRLFKNDKNLLKFPGAVGHLGIECDGPKGRLNTINLIHLNLAMNPREKREEKLEKYIQRLNGQWVHPINEHALLFEDFHYQIEPYRHPDKTFTRLLAQTVLDQQAAYQSVYQAAAQPSI
jgi:hypothetical protein